MSKSSTACMLFSYPFPRLPILLQSCTAGSCQSETPVHEGIGGGINRETVTILFLPVAFE
jgi:hypothetical protein